MGAIVFGEGAFPIKRIVLPGTTPPFCGEEKVGTIRLVGGPPKAVTSLCRDIQAYFSGEPVATPWGILDVEAMTPLQREVLRAVVAVSYGHTQTYGQIAARIGRPAACRFVGTTLRNNPFPVVIPCHRIIRADGSPGAFAGGMEGTDLKKRMLALEYSSCITQKGRRCAKKVGD
jgi:methylated-DNA-[protein]-cysteine S-methyltransferase